jgi:choline dehydrogenase
MIAQFDYVVVGAGSAGSIVASRLTEKADTSVLLLEAGPAGRALSIAVPLGYARNFRNPKLNWMYESEPIPGFGGRRTYVPRGKVLGGSGAINGMIYLRGAADDFEDWKAAGCTGWGWDDVRQDFEAVESRLGIGSMRDSAHPLSAQYLAAARHLGLPINRDFNGADQFGVGYNPVNICRGRRMSSAAAFLKPAAGRRNLKIETDASVERIQFEGRRAVGVAYLRGGEKRQARARREVIVSAGAINTPQLLQLSGIGPAELLSRHGIAVIAANGAVGRNLQDHVSYDHVYRKRVPTLNQELGPLHRRVWVALRYLFGRKGPLACGMTHGGGFFFSREGLNRPNLQLYFTPSSYELAPSRAGQGPQPDPFPGMMVGLSNCRPTSSGSVEIRSASPFDPPAIQPDFLATEHDVAEMLEGARFIRRLAAAPPLAAVIAEEVKPGPSVQQDSDMVADIRARGYSVFHPCGTARMGDGGAVDEKLRVRGVGGLRVIDASVFPNIIAGNINGAAMMVGWKGAGLVMDG